MSLDGVSEELMKRYGITEAEVMKWASESLPTAVRNKAILVQLYLKMVKGIEVSPRLLRGVRGKEKKVEDLIAGEWCVIRVLVGPRLRSTAYSGCPQCFRAVEGKECPMCGPITPKTLVWQEYIAGDETGEVPISLPPRITETGIDLTGKTIRASGALAETGEFRVSELEEAKPEAKPSAAVLTPVTISTSSQPSVSVTVSSPTPPAPAPAPSPSSAGQQEVQSLLKLLEIFGEIPYRDLELWHKSRQIKTPLEDLIRAVGGVREGDIVRRAV
jgi:hypothetical protein